MHFTNKSRYLQACLQLTRYQNGHFCIMDTAKEENGKQQPYF